MDLTSRSADDRPPRNGELLVDWHTDDVISAWVPGRTSRRTYFRSNVRAAIDAWGGFAGHLAARDEALMVVERVKAAKEDSVHEVFIPESRQYVTVVMRSDVWSRRGTAFIARGFVDHHVELAGGSWLRAGLYRTKLSTFRDKGATSESSEIPTRTCPTCFLHVPVSGECACGWQPDPHEH